MGCLTRVWLSTIIIISGFGIYGAAVVPDSGVGNTWRRLTLVLHEFLSNGLIPSRLHIVISFLTHADHVFLARDKPLQPEYRHNDCNDCTSLAALLVDCYVGMSLSSFEVCFDGNLKR